MWFSYSHDKLMNNIYEISIFHKNLIYKYTETHLS